MIVSQIENKIQVFDRDQITDPIAEQLRAVASWNKDLINQAADRLDIQFRRLVHIYNLIPPELPAGHDYTDQLKIKYFDCIRRYLYNVIESRDSGS